MRYFLLLLLGLLYVSATAQPDYPQGYFRNPLDIPILLAGNFGECRPNHFHTGIDIKTNARENMPVYAAAEGYISRISVSHQGYGNAIYITHPNGYVTVYGHLNDFYPRLQQYLRQKQYETQSWSADLNIPEGLFPVAKGEMIAYSGNTGGSTAPHLHFEIRDARTEHVLNGLLFGLPVPDKKAPYVKSIALYDGNQSIYEQQPLIIPLVKSGKIFKPKQQVITIPAAKIFLGVLANDYMEGSANSLGIYAASLKMDGILQAEMRLDQVDFKQNRYVNAFADYKLKEEKGSWYQGLYRLKGNRLDAYTFLNKAEGMLDISDGLEHSIDIIVRDAAGNESGVHMIVKQGNGKKQVQPCSELWTTEGHSLVSGTIKFALDNYQLYDDICFKLSETPSSKYYSNTVQLHETKVPLHHFTPLGLKLNKPAPFDLRGKLIFVHHIKPASLPGNNPQNAMAATYENGWAYADIRTFGNYYVAIDTVPPVITLLDKKNDFSTSASIRFSITDRLTSVTEMRAELDGKWLCFARRGNNYTYSFDDHCPPGQHTLVITAADENGNKSTFSHTFTR